MDEKEKQKRINYFDLKRDDFMALNEYLLSGLSERDLEKKAGGGMMNINRMTAPLGYDNGGQVGDKEEMIKAYNAAKAANTDGRFSDKDILFQLTKMSKGENWSDKDKEKIALAYKLAQAQNPDGRFSEKDFQLALEQVNASSADPSSMKSLADILNPDGRITDTDRKFSQELTGVPERENVDTTAMMSMLESWMYKNPDQRISERDIASMAINLARDMAGGSSNENVNMAIDRLNALLPSVKEKVRVENTDLFTQGIQSLWAKMRGKLEGRQNRGVGFERVR